MDFGEIKELHAHGRHETACILFAQMCTDALYSRHALPEGVSHLVHYTTLGCLRSMLGTVEVADTKYRLAARSSTVAPDTHDDSVGYLRLYDTFSSNDPNEGAFFVSSADGSGVFRQKYRAVWRLFEDRSASPAYQTSMTYVRNVSEADDLMFWRTYGREGTGCALALPIVCLASHQNLFKVTYGTAAAVSCLHTLSGLLAEYSAIPGAPDLSTVRRPADLPSPLVSALSPLVYLHKSEAYEYEKEVRIVIPFSDLRSGLYLQGSSLTTIPPRWRHFAELPSLSVQTLFVTESRILLGPTVQSAANVRFVLQKLLLAHRLYGPKVEKSTIAYRR